MAYLEKGLRNVGFSFILGFLAVAAGYATRMFLARTLDMSDFGLLYAAITTIAFLTIFTNLGFGSAQAKYIPHYTSKDEGHHVAGIIKFTFFTRTLFSVIVALIMIVFSSWFSMKYFKVDETFLVYLSAVGVILVTVFNTLSRFFQGFQRIFMMSFMEFFQKALFLLFVAASVITGLIRNDSSMIMLYILSVFAVILLSAPFLVRITSKLEKAVVSRELVKKILLFSATAALAQTGFMIVENLSTVMLTYLRTLEEVAVYSVVLPSTMALIFFGKSLSSVFLPMLSEMWAKNEESKIKEVMKMANKYVLFATLPIILIVIAFPEFFLSVFFGEKFIAGSNALRILCVGAFFLNISLVYQSALSAVDRIKYVTLSVMCSAVVNAVLNLALIPSMGYTGAAISTSVTYLVLLSQNVYNLRHFIDIKGEFFQVVKLLSAGILFLVCAFLINGLAVNIFIRVFLTLAVSGGVYLSFCFLTRIITINELRFFISKILGKEHE